MPAIPDFVQISSPAFSHLAYRFYALFYIFREKNVRRQALSGIKFTRIE